MLRTYLRHILFYTALTAGLILPCSGCAARKQTLYEKQLLYFDTVLTLQFYAGEDGDELMEHCIALCEDYEQIFSRTDPGSELYALNHRSTPSVEVSDELAELITVGLEYHEKSGGLFDITIAPLSDLWDFKSQDTVIPDEEDIRRELAKVDASGISIEDHTVTFASDDIMIDLGALVKGYAADQMKAYLTEHGVVSGNLNLGGNVLTIGRKPDGSAWRIGVRMPFDPGNGLADVIEAEDQTVVSSGIYERCFEKDGVIYHHILDPGNGYPIRNDIWGVTIVCDSSLRGDALSTTCLTLGFEKACEFLAAQEGVKAEFILSDGNLYRFGV